jgi:hypothetical protein
MPETRTARCHCRDLSLTLEGEPLLVSSCGCTHCQRRTGGFYGVTVYFRPAQIVARTGVEATFQRPDSTTTFRFCPRCGSNVWWAPDDDAWEDMMGVAGGCFAGQDLPSPQRMVYCATRHPYVRVPYGVPEYPDAPPE